LDHAGNGKQALLDEHGNFADVTNRLAPLLENARLPFHARGQFVDLALLVLGLVLKTMQFAHRGSDLPGKFLLLARIALDPVHHGSALTIESVEQARDDQFRLSLALGLFAGNEIRNRLLCLVERRAARGQPSDESLYRIILLPSVSDTINRRACPYCGE